MKDKILNVFVYIFTLATLILVVYFQNNLKYVAWIVGVGATIVGLLVILRKNNYGYLVFSAGFSLLMSAIFYTYKILDMSDSVTFMICMSIFLLMLITLIISFVNQKNIEKIYDKVVEASVSDLVKNPNTKKEYYQVIYEYVIGKNLYTVGTPDYINKFIPKIGDTIKLRVNSKDFADVFFDKRPLDKLYDMGLTIGLMIVTLVIIITLFI